MKKHRVVIIGGGHGQSLICRGVKTISNIDLNAIVTVADDGGSTGRLRKNFHIPAMGDIRNVMISMAESENMLSSLMDYRFDDPDGKEDDILGHNLGNLILTALTQQTGSFMTAIQEVSHILNVKGNIIPASTDVITLYARMEDGVIVRGEANIPNHNHHITRVFYQDEVHACKEAVEAIQNADLVIYGIGSVYTSILPNVIIPEIQEALCSTKAELVYFCNAMTQPGETDGYSVEDHVDALLYHHAPVDKVIVACDEIPEKILERYSVNGSTKVNLLKQDHPYQVVTKELLSFRNGFIHHDPEKIKAVIQELLEGEVMSFAAEVKQEVAQKIMEGNDIRAELSALIQMTSSLSLSNRGMTLLVSLENAAVSRTIYRLVKERYGVEISLFVKRKMNLRKNRIYGMRIMSAAPKILEDLGIYSTRGLLDKPLAKIVQTNNNARAYLAGAFMAGGSINSPEKSSYHLEITATSEEHALFMISLLERFNIHAKITTRRKKVILYVKSAEKIADFLRLIEADQAVLKFENIRISRDFSNSLQRMNNMDLANEVKAVAAASGQLDDIRILEENQKIETLDRKLQDIITLRKANPEASLMELCSIYERQTGEIVSKSGMKHRFVKIHELAMKEVKQDE